MVQRLRPAPLFVVALSVLVAVPCLGQANKRNNDQQDKKKRQEELKQLIQDAWKEADKTEVEAQQLQPRRQQLFEKQREADLAAGQAASDAARARMALNDARVRLAESRTALDEFDKKILDKLDLTQPGAGLLQAADAAQKAHDARKDAIVQELQKSAEYSKLETALDEARFQLTTLKANDGARAEIARAARTLNDAENAVSRAQQAALQSDAPLGALRQAMETATKAYQAQRAANRRTIAQDPERQPLAAALDRAQNEIRDAEKAAAEAQRRLTMAQAAATAARSEASTVQAQQQAAEQRVAQLNAAADQAVSELKSIGGKPPNRPKKSSGQTANKNK